MQRVENAVLRHPPSEAFVGTAIAVLHELSDNGFPDGIVMKWELELYPQLHRSKDSGANDDPVAILGILLDPALFYRSAESILFCCYELPYFICIVGEELRILQAKVSKVAIEFPYHLYRCS